jgi:hypothetical protein
LSFLIFFFRNFQFRHNGFESGPFGSIPLSAGQEDSQNVLIIVFGYRNMMILIIANEPNNLRGGQVLIRYLTGEHFPNQYAKAINIGIALILIAFEYFRCHPMRRAHPNILLLIIFGGVDPTQAKITQLDVPILIDQDVAAFQVAMQEVLAVEVGHAQSHVFHYVEYLLLGEFLLLFVQVVE